MTNTNEVRVLTPALIKERFANMRAACGNVPAHVGTRKTYQSRALTLLKRDVLQYLDRPDEFLRKIPSGEETPMATETARGYLTPTGSAIQLCALLEGPPWNDLFTGSREEAVFSYRAA